MNCLLGDAIFVYAWFRLDTGVQGQVSVDICDWHVYVFVGNSDTGLLLFL